MLWIERSETQNEYCDVELKVWIESRYLAQWSVAILKNQISTISNLTMEMSVLLAIFNTAVRGFHILHYN